MGGESILTVYLGFILLIATPQACSWFYCEKHTMLVDLAESPIVRVVRGNHFFTTLYRRSFTLHHSRNLDKTSKSENNIRHMFSVHSWLPRLSCTFIPTATNLCLTSRPAGRGSPRGGVGSCCSKTHLVNIFCGYVTQIYWAVIGLIAKESRDTSSGATPSRPIHERMLQFGIQGEEKILHLSRSAEATD